MVCGICMNICMYGCMDVCTGFTALRAFGRISISRRSVARMLADGSREAQRRFRFQTGLKLGNPSRNKEPTYLSPKRAPIHERYGRKMPKVRNLGVGIIRISIP